MQLSIVKIGNSKGVRIPKAMLEQCGLEKTVDVEVRDHRIILSAPEHPRRDWDKAFRAMRENGDDILLDDPSANDWDRLEWEWK